MHLHHLNFYHLICVTSIPHIQYFYSLCATIFGGNLCDLPLWEIRSRPLPDVQWCGGRTRLETGEFCVRPDGPTCSTYQVSCFVTDTYGEFISWTKGHLNAGNAVNSHCIVRNQHVYIVLGESGFSHRSSIYL